MEHYTDLAFRYIKMNRRRSILTVMGVSVAVALLYLMLNLSWSYLLNYRQEIRSIKDYEMVLFTENTGQIESILQDSRVKDGVVADYYEYDYYEPVNHKNSLYINTINPYRMDDTLEGLSQQYGVEGELNASLAAAYLQGDEGALVYLAILVALIVAYIAAIFGVGLIRNSIQLTMLERIKDFGQLRCIGSTKKQMRLVVFLQGAVLELYGLAIGTGLGVIASIAAGSMLRWKNTGFHILPLVLVFAAFIFDLFFAMDENAKLVANMTPVSAIRGEYRIKKERYRRRSSRLFTKLFGVEGDYAYKSIRRNPGRFLRTVSAMTIGVAGVIVIFGMVHSLKKLSDIQEGEYGYYHIYYEHPLMPWESYGELVNSGAPVELLNQISELSGLSESKRSYIGMAPTASWDEDVISRYREEYFEKAYEGAVIDQLYEAYDEMNDPVQKGWWEDYRFQSACIPVCGYDEEDLARYEEDLIDGSLPHSDKGIMMVVSNYIDVFHPLSFSYRTEMYLFSNYKVGDTIRIINVPKYRENTISACQPVTEKYEAEAKKLEEAKGEALRKEDNELWEKLDKKKQELDDDYENDINVIRRNCYYALVDAGDYEEYTIEGILKGDANRGRMLSDTMDRMKFETSMPFPTIIVPKSEYMEIMGVDEQWVSGMRYHFDRLNPMQFFNVDDGGYAQDMWQYESEVPTWQELQYHISYTNVGSEYGMFKDYDTSAYPIWLQFKQKTSGKLIGAGIAVLFLVAMTMFNTLNATASSLYMRRRELAQLRVLGLSKKGLFKLVMLEGVIEALIACVLGIIIGTVVSLGMFYGVIVFFQSIDYAFPLLAVLLSVVVTVLILCGAVYFPLKSMPNDVAAELMTAGE